MNRPLPAILLVTLVSTIAACGGGSFTDGVEPPPPEQGLLKQVSSPAELEQSIKSGFTAIRDPRALPHIDFLAELASGNFTGTYTQEARVDEFDAVRYDGSHLYIAPRRYFRCCFLAVSIPGNNSNPPESSIRILETDPANGSATLVSTIPLEDDVSVQGMYVDGDRMFALTGTSVFGHFGGMWADIAVWSPEKLGYRVYDLTDRAAPQLEVEATIDGVFVDSRRIANTVYIVSRYAPWIENLDYNVTTPEQQTSNEVVLDGVSLDALLPTITVNGVTRSLITPENCFIDSSDDADGSPVLTSVTAVPIDDPAAFSTTCYNQEAYGAYVSENAIYFTEFQDSEEDNHFDTRIHKFALSGTLIDYRGSADIDGRVVLHDSQAVTQWNTVAQLSAQQLVDGHAGGLAGQVVKGHVDCRLGIGMSLDDSIHLLVKGAYLVGILLFNGGKQVGSHHVSDGSRVLTVIHAVGTAPGGDGRGFAPAPNAFIGLQGQNVVLADGRLHVAGPVVNAPGGQLDEVFLVAFDDHLVLLLSSICQSCRVSNWLVIS